MWYVYSCGHPRFTPPYGTTFTKHMDRLCPSCRVSKTTNIRYQIKQQSLSEQETVRIKFRSFFGKTTLLTK